MTNKRSSRLLSLTSLIVVSYSLLYYLQLARSTLRPHQLFFDDSYMFIRYAKNFLAGYGHAWNPDGVQTYGSTSLLYFMVVTALKASLPRVDDTVILVLASSSMGLIGALFLIFTCASYSKSKLFKHNFFLWGAIFLPVLLLRYSFNYHAMNGMDTMLALLTNTVLIFFTLRMASADEAKAVALIPVVIAAYLAYLARPDNGLYAVLFPLLAITFLVRSNNKKQLLIAFSLAFFAVLLADAFVKYLIFGDIVPLPFYAKKSGFYDGYVGVHIWNPIRYLWEFFLVSSPTIFLMLLFGKKRHTPVLAAFLIPVALTVVYYFSVTQIMGAWARYYYPSLPFLIVSGALVLDDYIVHQKHFTMNYEGLSLRIILIVALLSSGPLANALVDIYADAFLKVSPITYEIPFRVKSDEQLPHSDGETIVIAEVAEIAEDTPNGTVIAMSEYGFISAIAPHVTIIDVMGLHDKYFAYNGFDAEELFNRKPDLIWFPHWYYTKMVKSIQEDKRLREEYLYFPEAFDYGLAIRKDSDKFEVLYALIEKIWEKNYPNHPMDEHLAIWE